MRGAARGRRAVLGDRLMLYYIARRVLTMIPTLFVISLLIFVIIELPAGDYISNQIAALRAAGESASIAKLEFLRAEFALDRPFLERYLIWIGLWPGVHGLDGLLQGNWGWSFEYEKPVSEVVGPTLPLTIVLNTATILFVYIVSFPIGIYSATRQYSWGDYGFTFIGYIGARDAELPARPDHALFRQSLVRPVGRRADGAGIYRPALERGQGAVDPGASDRAHRRHRNGRDGGDDPAVAGQSSR